MALVGGVSSRGDTLSPRNFFFPSFLSFFFFFICVFFPLSPLSLSLLPLPPTTAGKKLHDMYIVARGEQEFILLICFGDRRNWKERTRVKERLQPGNGTWSKKCQIHVHWWIFLLEFWSPLTVMRFNIDVHGIRYAFSSLLWAEKRKKLSCL